MGSNGRIIIVSTILKWILALFLLSDMNPALTSPAPARAQTATRTDKAGPRPKTDRFGIFSIPQSDRALPLVNELGVGWVRLQHRMGERQQDFAFVLDHGLGFWLTLYHRDDSNVRDREGVKGAARGGFPPRDPERYKELVRRTVRPLVERLRAAGKEPGVWLVIQVENEVVPSDVAPPRPQRFWHGTAAEYLQTLALGYEAVKSVDPSLPVASAGMVLPRPPTGTEPLAKWHERMLRDGRMDWADVHLYDHIDTIPARVNWIRGLWRGPLAATEIGGPDERTGVRYSEELHAQDLIQRLRTALKSGVDRVFWAHLDENPHADARFQPMGLVTRQWRKKPAFEAYKRLIAEETAVSR